MEPDPANTLFGAEAAAAAAAGAGAALRDFIASESTHAVLRDAQLALAHSSCPVQLVVEHVRLGDSSADGARGLDGALRAALAADDLPAVRLLMDVAVGGGLSSAEGWVVDGSGVLMQACAAGAAYVREILRSSRFDRETLRAAVLDNCRTKNVALRAAVEEIASHPLLDRVADVLDPAAAALTWSQAMQVMANAQCYASTVGCFAGMSNSASLVRTLHCFAPHRDHLLHDALCTASFWGSADALDAVLATQTPLSLRAQNDNSRISWNFVMRSSLFCAALGCRVRYSDLIGMAHVLTETGDLLALRQRDPLHQQQQQQQQQREQRQRCVLALLTHMRAHATSCIADTIQRDLLCALASRDEHCETLRIVLNVFSDLRSDVALDALRAACKHGAAGALDVILTHPRAQPLCARLFRDSAQWAACFRLAARRGHGSVVKRLLACSSSHLRVSSVSRDDALGEDDCERRAMQVELVAAASGGRAAVVAALLADPRCDPNAAPRTRAHGRAAAVQSRSALVEAATWGHASTVRELLKHPDVHADDAVLRIVVRRIHRGYERRSKLFFAFASSERRRIAQLMDALFSRTKNPRTRARVDQSSDCSN